MSLTIGNELDFYQEEEERKPDPVGLAMLLITIVVVGVVVGILIW